MRRKPGTLIPIEEAILAAALDLFRDGTPEFHGFALAVHLGKRQEAVRQLRSYGTLYRALQRMEQSGLLWARWEAARDAMREGRPRRRLYTVTPEGSRALAASRARQADAARSLRTREA